MRPSKPSITNPCILALAPALLLMTTGCSKSETESPAAEAAVESAALPRDAAAGAADEQAPGLTTSAAPGVAFDYRYAFTLKANAISGVQRQHAAACERLGPTRCQVTGMTYEQPRADEVSARLDFLLAPELAHQFASEGIATVERADGKLDNALVTGEDAGGQIEVSQRRSAVLKAELARIERRLMAKGLSAEERVSLANQAQDLRSQLGSEVEVRQAKEASLATTPVSFAYQSEGLLGGSDPFGTAAKSSLGSLKSMLALLLAGAGLALPWLLLAAFIVLLLRLRSMKQRVAALTAGAAASGATPPEGPAAQ